MAAKTVRHVVEEAVFVKDLKVLKLRNALHAMGMENAPDVREREKCKRELKI